MIKNNVKKFVIQVISFISLYCIIYYTIKLYQTKYLVFDYKSIIPWSIIAFMTIISLFIGVYNINKIAKIEEQNKELKIILLKLTENSDEYYDSICHHLQNSRELSLDIFNEVCER